MYRMVLIGFLLGALCSACLFGRPYQGAINGYVTDPSGDPVANASVVIANEQTGTETKTLTDSSGFYNSINLVPGQY